MDLPASLAELSNLVDEKELNLRVIVAIMKKNIESFLFIYASEHSPQLDC